SANYSGAGFSDMVFNTDAVPGERFAAWVTAARNGPVLDAQSYAALAKPSRAVAPLTYGAVAPGLFGEIVSSVGTSHQASSSVVPCSLADEKGTVGASPAGTKSISPSGSSWALWAWWPWALCSSLGGSR